jgi:hypothetical protein
MSPVDTDVERRLRAGLHAWQEAIAPAPADFPALLRARRRRRRRARLAVAGAVAAVAAVITSVVVVRGILPVESPPSVAGPGEGSGRMVLPDLADVPTRGSLADDPGWVAGVAELAWPPREGLPAADFVPRLEDRHVAFAGDVPGGRVALVLGEIGNRTLRMWFTGPPDAGTEDLRPAVEADEVLPDRPLALWELMDDGADDGVLVVVAFPGDTAQFAPGLLPRDEVDDSVVEAFSLVALEDGAGSVTAPRPVGFPLSTLVFVTHEVGSSDVPLDVGSRAAAALGLPVLEDPRGLRADVPSEWLDETLHQLAVLPGMDVDDLTVTLLQAGGVRDTANRSSVLVVGTAPDGAQAVVLRDFTTVDPVTATDADRGSGDWSSDVAVTETGTFGRPTQQVFAVPLDDALVVSAPVPDGTVEVLDGGGDVLVALPLRHGAASSVVPVGAAAIRVLDAAGDVVAEQPLTEVRK